MAPARKIIVIGLFLAMFAPWTKAEQKTTEDRLAEFSEPVRQRLEPKFRAAGVQYPPKHITLIGVKQDRVLEVYAAGPAQAQRFVCAYPVLAASGSLGPKLLEGDKQVPEGIYDVAELNPNSRFHLSLRLDYPNTFDRTQGKLDHRTKLGGLIMIHGEAVSKGCLAMGNPAAEDLFVLAAQDGISNVRVILTPVDFRKKSLPVLPTGAPLWSAKLYDLIKAELAKYPASDR